MTECSCYNYNANAYDSKYTTLIRDILDNGKDRPDRTGIGSRALFGKSFTVDLADGFPILTTRKVAFRIAFEETMFFLRGETDTKKLEEKKINIWKGNTTREFLDKMGLQHLPEGDMGKGYGYQWTQWEKYSIKRYNDVVEHADGSKTFLEAKVILEHINQVKEMLERAKKNPNDRRLLFSAWNPAQLGDTPLVPCHMLSQYQVLDGKLNSLWFQRSVDSIYGLPYNVMSYAFLNLLFSKALNLIPGELTFFGGDTHIYMNQVDIATEQVDVSQRFGFDLPKLEINKDINTWEDIVSLQYEDVKLVGYEAHPDFKNKPPMAV